jgi:hypothetical protein
MESALRAQALADTTMMATIHRCTNLLIGILLSCPACERDRRLAARTSPTTTTIGAVALPAVDFRPVKRILDQGIVKRSIHEWPC